MAAAELAAAGTPLEITGEALRQGLERALSRLREQRDEINQLNVFPVPDGDTGSNLHLTMEAAWQEVERLPRQAALAEVSRAAAQGSLMGARGNSGVILSQVLRGFAGACQGWEALDPEGLCQALDQASRVASQAVKRPVEGTILSVARDAASAARSRLEEGGDLAEVLEATTQEAWAAVGRSQEQMELLRQAGVVDAGGFGLSVVLSALAESFAGPEVWPDGLAPGRRRRSRRRAGSQPAAGASLAEKPFGYCTEFILVEAGLEPLELRRRLGDEAADDSALVVGDAALVHVHIHTETPWELLSRAAHLGRIERLKVEDMSAQHRRLRREARAPEPRPERETSSPVGVVMVASGKGFRELLLGLGAATVVDGGQSANPSTEELLSGIESASTRATLLLPDNANLLLAAEQAKKLAPHPVAVVPSRNLPQGIAALLAFDPQASLRVNRRRMEQAMSEVHAIELAEAQRGSRVGDLEIEKGQLLAMLDGQPVSAGADLGEVVVKALGALPEDAIEVVTLYRGAGVAAGVAKGLERAIRQAFPGLEVECHDGGQELYPFIISAE